MAHPSKIVLCDGPDAPHAFDHIPMRARHGALDEVCPVCRGHGAWNTEIDLISHRAKRHACEACHGSGWIETGADPVLGHDIAMSAGGYPKWGTSAVGGRKRDSD